MKPIPRLLRRLRDAVTPAERPLVVVFVLAEPARPPEAETPGGTLPHLDIELAISVFERADMAEETRKSYTGELRRQAEWLDGRPHTDRLLTEYLDMLDDKRRARSSAVTAVAAVRRAVRELALDGYEIAEPPAGPLAARRLKRYRREGAGRGRGQAGALRWKDADDMCKCAATAKDPRGIRDAALIAVVSSTLLRVSEASALDAADVTFRADGSAELEIRRSKTDQYAEGKAHYLTPAAAAWLREWMDTAGIESGPLFRPVIGRRIVERRLGAAAVRAVIKRRATRAGISRPVSGHSLRVGAVLSLAERNASLVEIQIEGRWKSPAMPAYYARNQEAHQGAVARLRGGAAKKPKKDVAPPETAVVEFG